MLSLPCYAGVLVEYTISIQNTGNVALTSIDVSNQTAGLSTVQCGANNRFFTLPANQAVTCKAAYRFSHADLQDGGKTHTFKVSAYDVTVQLRDVTVVAAYGCETCRTCVGQFAGVCRQNLPLAGSAADVARALCDFCLSTGRTQSSCDSLRAYINEPVAVAATAGWRGLRAGAVCQKLNECALAGSLPNRNGMCGTPGAADTCTVQGTATGDLIPGSSRTLGEMQLWLKKSRLVTRPCLTVWPH